MTNAATTLTTTAAGESRSFFSVKAGEYIWHAGAYRRVTDAYGRTIRMGRYVLHAVEAWTVEVAP